MSDQNKTDVELIIKIVKAMYKNRIEEASQHLKNIDYINIDVLKEKIEKEITEEHTPDKYTKIVSIIESLVQD